MHVEALWEDLDWTSKVERWCQNFELWGYSSKNMLQRFVRNRCTHAYRPVNVKTNMTSVWIDVLPPNFQSLFIHNWIRLNVISPTASKKRDDGRTPHQTISARCYKTVHIFPVLATFGQLLTIFRSNFNSIHYTGLHPYPAGLRLYLWSLLFGRNSMPVTQVLLLMYEALVKLFEKVFRSKFNSMIWKEPRMRPTFEHWAVVGV